jgi:hypothetical protein
MHEENPRRALTWQVNPQLTVEKAKESTVSSMTERLDSLTPIDQIAELQAYDNVGYEQTKRLMTDHTLPSEAKAALKGLLRAKHQRANWLTSDRLRS